MTIARGRTCSIGVAIQQPGESALETVNRADQALYQAKRSGRNLTVWHGGNREDELRHSSAAGEELAPADAIGRAGVAGPSSGQLSSLVATLNVSRYVRTGELSPRHLHPKPSLDRKSVEACTDRWRGQTS
jgi:hypothetical protein